MFIVDYIKTVYNASASLLKGMRMTGYYFFNHKEIITQQYPDVKQELPERFRGEVVMTHDEKNEHRCTGCTACELACPNATIKIVTKMELCLIYVLWLVQLMRLKWRRHLSIVCLTEIN